MVALYESCGICMRVMVWKSKGVKTMKIKGSQNTIWKSKGICVVLAKFLPNNLSQPLATLQSTNLINNEKDLDLAYNSTWSCWIFQEFVPKGFHRFFFQFAKLPYLMVLKKFHKKNATLPIPLLVEDKNICQSISKIL